MLTYMHVFSQDKPIKDAKAFCHVFFQTVILTSTYPAVYVR